MKIPLVLKLKKREHKEIALMQDEVVRSVYDFFEKAVLHGGTTIWRCFSGNRFSEDVDFIMPKKEKEKFSKFVFRLKNHFQIKKSRIKENAAYLVLSKDRREIRFEATFRNVSDYIIADYETADGSFLIVYTLSPEKLLLEKIDAYLAQRKIRDLYDVSFLLKFVQKNKAVISALKKLISNYEKPMDEPVLKALIYTGLVPSGKELIEKIKRWVK